MQGTVQSLVTRLLNCAGAGEAKPVVEALVQELCRITDVDVHPVFFHDESATLTPQGKAVSLVTAAQCAEDVERTRVFIQGINAAIQEKLASLPSHLPLRILYAGTGPFGLLLVPLLPLFASERIHATLLDIHSESLEKVKLLVEHLGIEHLVNLEQTDACQWSSAEKYDLIISETMRQGLIQEPQVSVFAHLQQYLADDGLLIPEIIRLDLWLSRAGIMKTDVEPLWLGQLFQLDKITSRQLGAGDDSATQGSLVIPDYQEDLCDLKLTTFIQVYKQYHLQENQSQLTLPLYEKNARPTPGSELRYSYVMGTYPHCKLEYAQAQNESIFPLPDICVPNQRGLYHLNRLWQKVQYQKSGSATRKQVSALAQEEWMLDRLLIDSLGLGLEPTLEQLYRSQQLADFEAWISATNEDALSAESIAKANRNIQKFLQTKNHPDEKYPTPLSAEQLAFWDEHGYLIVPGVLNQDECANARVAMWEFLGMKEADPHSWYRSSADMKKIMVQMFKHPALDVARNSDYIRAIFQQLWQQDNLIVITDRVSFNPPETQDWKFPGPGMHWDVDLKAPVPFATQALIYLTDVAEHQGAFCCVPGFHKKIDRWLRDFPPGVDPADQDWSQWPVKPIAANAGDLIIWHQALPHGGSPNLADYPRMVQYINMYR